MHPLSSSAPSPPTQDDAALFRRLADQDREAFAELFRRHSRAVYNFAFRRTASWSLAEDVVQATFVTVWRRAVSGSIRPIDGGSARAVLLVLAGYECANVARSQRRSVALQARLGSWREAPPEDLASTVAAAVDDEADMRRLRGALDQVPKEQREIVELVTWSGCTIPEAAAALGVPVGTAKARLSRARARLRDLVDIPEETS